MTTKTQKYIYAFICFLSIALGTTPLCAQVKRPLTDADKSALEGVEVEKYYTYNPADAMDTLGGCLSKGAVTYRIYIDLKPGYNLQAVYGVLNHPLFIKTSTLFFNNTQYGQGTGDYVDHKKMLGSSASFDSFLTMGAASNSDMGVPKADDKDGSLIKIKSFASADGLMPAKIKPVTYFGIIPNFFNVYNPANTFSTDNGSWAVFGGVTGATESNKILIAQLTTDGVLSYELNIQVGTPSGGSVNYVAKNPQDQEIKFDALTKAVN